MSEVLTAGAEFSVNTNTASNQTAPEIAALPDSGYVIVWGTLDSAQDGSDSAIKAQRFDASGNPVGSEFLVNNESAGSQFTPDVAVFSDGSFVISWTTNDAAQDGDSSAIKARLFDASGNPVGSEFLVNSQTSSSQDTPRVTVLDNGNFVVSWSNWNGFDTKAQIFGSDGQKIGGEFGVNESLSGTQDSGDIVALEGGGFVVTWRTTNSASDGSGTAVMARVFDSSGVGGAEFVVNSAKTGDQYMASVAALADGGFVVVWHTLDSTQDGSSGAVKAQMFDASGVRVGSEFLVNSEVANSQREPMVTALPDGGFVVVWSTLDTLQDGSGMALKGQYFDASGQPVLDEFLVNSLTSGAQFLPSVATLSDGSVLVTWASESGDGNGYAVRGRMFDMVHSPEIVSDGGGDTAAVSIDENQTSVTQVVATAGGSGDGLTYAIDGGADASLFTIDPDTGALSFIAAPDFESPAGDGDNLYEVNVTVSNSSFSDTQAIAVTVNDIAEPIVGTPGDDFINGTSGDDTIDASQGGNDVINGGDGNDTITAGDGYNQIDAGDGDDVIYGGDGFGDDIIDGAGNDTVYGGGNFDRFYGSAGNDSYDGMAPGEIDDQYDEINYSDALAAITVDLVAASNNVHSTVGDDAGIGIDQLTNIEGVRGTQFADSMTGNDGGNFLDGGLGNDIINGAGGNDELRGWAGADTIDGGDGDDEISGDWGDDTINGGAGDDYIADGTGSDTVYGGAGSDEILASIGTDEGEGDGTGNDTYDGGTGLAGEIDTVSYWEAQAGIVVDLWAPSGQVHSLSEGDAAGVGVDSLVNVEAVVGSQFDDVMTGNDADNILFGGAGNDLLTDGAGSDLIVGGEGYDQITASTGAGIDVYDGGEEFFTPFDHDLIRYVGAAAGVAVNLTTGTGQSVDAGDAAGIGIDELLNIEDVDGSAYNDQIIGSTDDNNLFGLGGNDTISGGFGIDSIGGGDGDDTLSGDEGNDFLNGGNGNDTIDGGAGIDRASYTASAVGVTVSLAITGAQNTGQGLDTLTGIENLIGSQYSDRLYGNEGANTLNGFNGDDYLYGNGGNDRLEGVAGDDRLFGGAGNDTLIGGAGYDRMYGGVGDDIYTVSDATDFAYEEEGEGTDLVNATINHQLRANVENLTLGGTANLIGEGNELGNVITGNSGANRLYGYDGNDSLLGQGGDDYLLGGAGNDTLNGGTGYDRMYGGTGDDTYIVNDTTDYAFENAGEGIDRVIASINHTLRDNIEQLELAGSGDLRGYGNAEDNLILGNSGANLLYGRDGNDSLDGAAGNDILYGENGNDTLRGGAGQDRFYGGTGADDFIFNDGDFAGITSGTADRIHDFSQLEGDQISLAGVDANVGLGGDQSFNFIGTGAFSGAAGELRYQQISGQTYIQGDTNGDGVADFMIRLDGLHNLQASDFLI